MNLTQLSKQIHAAAKAKGFWEEEPNMGQVFMLIISEAAEALEAHRKGMFADMKTFDMVVDNDSIKGFDENNPFYKSLFIHTFKENIKDTLQDEIADIAIRALDFAGYKNGVLEDIEIFEILTDNVGEMLIDVCEDIVNARLMIEWKSERAAFEKIMFVLNGCFSIAARLEFDLMKHIDLKLRYNASRPYKHGKKY